MGCAQSRGGGPAAGRRAKAKRQLGRGSRKGSSGCAGRADSAEPRGSGARVPEGTCVEKQNPGGGRPGRGSPGSRGTPGPRGGAAPRAATSKTLFSLQGPHRGARHAGPERPSCSLRVTKGPGATAEPHRAARAQHTLDSAIFTPGKRAEGGVAPGVRVRRAPAPPRPAARTRRTGRGAPPDRASLGEAGPRAPGGPGLDAAPLPPAGPEMGRPQRARARPEGAPAREPEDAVSLRGPLPSSGPQGPGAGRRCP